LTSRKQKTEDTVQHLLAKCIKLVSEHKEEDAEILLQRLLKIQPENADAWWLLGRALSLQNKVGETLAAYDQAVQLEPERAVFWETLGVTLLQTGKLTEGKNALTKAFELDTLSLRPAEYTFGKLIEANHENALYWYGLGVVLEIQGKIETSRKAMLKAKEFGLENT
jgi:cytochrome c-type biogenesis protein CcmH/NrfG